MAGDALTLDQWDWWGAGGDRRSSGIPGGLRSVEEGVNQ